MQNRNQDYRVPADYVWIRDDSIQWFTAVLSYSIAWGMGLIYSRLWLHVYILTAALDLEAARCEPVTDPVVDFLNALLNNRDGGSVRKLDVAEHFMACLPEKNLGTRFTPCCMLRLFADQVEEIPDRILYLDADVVCRKNIRDFYHQDMTGWELDQKQS